MVSPFATSFTASAPPIRAAAGRTALRLALGVGALLFGAAALAQGAADPTRGRLLYETHCVACHNTQMHWRDKRQATDWASLLGQVQAWQVRENLAWSGDDVLEVTRHLNESIYRFAAPPAPARSAPGEPLGGPADPFAATQAQRTVNLPASPPIIPVFRPR